MSTDSGSSPFEQKIVLARAPTLEGGQVKLVVDVNTLKSIVRMPAGQRDKLGQYLGLVHGNPWLPDQPHSADDVTSGMTAPVAIFQGLKRPKNVHRHDTETVIYVLPHRRNYVFLGNNAMRVAAPAGAVFVVYADFGGEAVDAAKAAVTYTLPDDVKGVVCDWEWVAASPSDARLPVDATVPGRRYTRKIWDERDAA